MVSDKNIILTGVPRAGTTLACNLLNRLNNAVALHEPMEALAFPRQADRGTICALVDAFFSRTRESILQIGVAPSRHVDGRIPENNYEERADENGLRRTHAWRSEITISKKLSPDFMLCLKEPVAFTFYLEYLIKWFPCFAIVRNPLSVLASWNSIDSTMNQGRLGFIEERDAALRAELARSGDVIERQIRLLSWFYEQYLEFLPDDCVLCYEELVASKGRKLRRIDQEAGTLDEPLENMNTNRLYDQVKMLQLGERLLGIDGAFWHYYNRDSVESILSDLMQIEVVSH